MEGAIFLVFIVVYICTLEPLYIVAAALFLIADSLQTIASRIKGK